MSRIPVPSSSPLQARNVSVSSPVPFPGERASSPLPGSRHAPHSSMSSLSGLQSETRKKTSKRDEVTFYSDSLSLSLILSSKAIRKKIESELSRKRTISTTQTQQRRRGIKPTAQKGTVAALKPSPALTVPENITVAEASQLCAAKRTDCVLVVDDEEGLSGIFTAKDLAYRVCI